MDDLCKGHCDNGRHYITEDEHSAMLTAVRGTGKPICTEFGPRGVWIACPWCRSHTPTMRDSIVATIGIWLDVKRNLAATTKAGEP